MNIQAWQVATSIAIGVVGTAGLASTIRAIIEFTKPERIRREVERLATIRDLLPNDSDVRQDIETHLERVAEQLLAPSEPRPFRRFLKSRATVVTLVAGIGAAITAAMIVIVDQDSTPPSGFVPIATIIAAIGTLWLSLILRDLDREFKPDNPAGRNESSADPKVS